MQSVKNIDGSRGVVDRTMKQDSESLAGQQARLPKNAKVRAQATPYFGPR
jgi:hypothetical protein